jgi:uncharacterized protein
LLASALMVGGCKQAENIHAERPAPAIKFAGRVTDEADLLTPEQETQLSDALTAFEQRTKHQIVVVTVKSLNGRDIALFTRNLANAWGIGRRDHDDGVVMLVAPNERKVRIAVGFGLEKALPDAVAKRIIDADMVPRFKEKDYFGGINAGTCALIEHLD